VSGSAAAEVAGTGIGPEGRIMLDAISRSSPWFDARTSTSGTTCTVVVSGELDLAVAERFEAEVAAVLAEAPRTVVIDLSAVDFIDSSGVHVLLSAHRRAAARALRLVVVTGPADHAQKVFRACGVDRVLGFAAAAGEPAPC
jgi:anti-sigma B factor antagonist